MTGAPGAPAPFEVVALGESMLRLTPPDKLLLSQARTMGFEVGGSESNVLVGLAQLGRRVAWLSRLSDNAIGRVIESTIRQHGVFTDTLTWTPESRNGLYIIEEGVPPRPSRVTYDREHSAFSQITPKDIPVETLRHARLFHTSGITLAVSQHAYKTAETVLAELKTHHIPLSFDVNYRAKLATLAEAREQCLPFIACAELVFVAERDARAIFAPKAQSASDVLHALHTLNPQATFVMTQGAEGASAITPTADSHHQHAVAAHEVCRIGRGDAFVAGFLHGYLGQLPLPRCLQYGTAAAALKASLAGDMLLTCEEVLVAMIDHGAVDVQR